MRGYIPVVVICLVTAGTLITLKFSVWGYRLSSLLPETGFHVSVYMRYTGAYEGLRIRTWMPVSDAHQEVLEIQALTPEIPYHLERTLNGTIIQWEGIPPSPSGEIQFQYTVRMRAVEYVLPDSLPFPEILEIPASFRQFLSGTPEIPLSHPVIEELYQRLVPPSRNALEHVRRFYEHVLQYRNRPFRGMTDAVTTALLQEASCNGKSRLLVALLRKSGIPARLVGGIILESGEKRTAHQWVEVYLGNMWIPLDPTNGHFAFLPENYLILYRGDQPVFTFSRNIGFSYRFEIRSIRLPNRFFEEHLAGHPLNAYRAWEAFQRAGIPLSLLAIVIMLPLGAVVISFFRNVVGLQTFGTFLPALISAASVPTGVEYGMAGFFAIIVLVSLLYFPLERWNITHNPRMAILMIAVVSLLLVAGVLYQWTDLEELAYFSLFPVAVLTITAERFAQILLEEGWKQALAIALQTALVIWVVYLLMTMEWLQSFFLAFPELYLVLLALAMLLGRWTGFRLLEYWRFYPLWKHFSSSSFSEKGHV